MKKLVMNLQEETISENLRNYNKKVALRLSLITLLVSGIMGFFAYSTYKNSPEDGIVIIRILGVFFVPFLLYIIYRIIKALSYASNLHKIKAYKNIEERFNLNNEADFLAFELSVKSEATNSVISNGGPSAFLLTNSYIISNDAPMNTEFDIYNAKKLVMIEYTPLKISDYIVKHKYWKKSGHRIVLYFEDELIIFFAVTKKAGYEICKEFVRAYKIPNIVDEDYRDFYKKDRNKFIQHFRQQAQEL